jgi:hypothetical protein
MYRRLLAGLFFLSAAILLAACAGTASTPTPVVATLPAQAVTSDASPETCAAMQALMTQTLGMEVTLSSGPFVDPITGQTGNACVNTVTGTGVNFPNGPDTNAVIAAMQAQGWTMLNNYAAGGPTGNIAGFDKADELCVYTEHWQPAPEVQCPADQPISACAMKPEQRLWTITMQCVNRAPTPPA